MIDIKQKYPHLERDFYLGKNVVDMAKELLGTYLCTYINGNFTVGLITETEAYCGATDKACHAFGGKYTERTRPMYLLGGHAYVYLCYGIHELVNIVVGQEGKAEVILIRAITPVEGILEMEKRRGILAKNHHFTNGPGKLTQALGIDRKLNKADLVKSNDIWLSHSQKKYLPQKIEVGTRIGISDKEAASYPWRFWFSPEEYHFPKN